MDALTTFLNQEVPGFSWIWQIFESLPVSHTTRVLIMSGVVPMVWFYLYGFLLFLVDFTASDSFIAKYKVQNTFRPTREQYMAALKVSLFNWVILGQPYMYVLALYCLPTTIGPIPTVYMFLRDLVVYVLLEEILFYSGHRLLHHPMFYAPIHKFHHTYTAPFGIAAVYAHPIEHMLSNVLPVSAGPVLMQSHPIVPMVWGVLALFNTMNVHSGYDFTHLLIFPSPYFHDWHHEKFNENFGVGLGLDYMLGTSKNFSSAIAKGLVYVPRIKKNKAD